MREVKIVFILILIEFVFGQMGESPLIFKPCKNDLIFATLVPGASPEENQYVLTINKTVPQGMWLKLKFDSDATIELLDETEADIYRRFNLLIYKSLANFTMIVKGPAAGPIPYLTSMTQQVKRRAEYCDYPQKGYLDPYIKLNTTSATETTPKTTTQRASIKGEFCGRRKVHHVGLVVNGSPTKPGDWPWHAAIYQLDRSRIDYICGGTLLNKFFVLTAGHCVTLRGRAVLPESRNVILGKYNLVGGDLAPQEHGVFQIIVHEGYLQNVLDHDIALMKLKSEATYNDYVQPACLWHSGINKQASQENIQGTVVGWGFDQTDSLATTLQQATIPIVSELQCIKSNPLFYTRLLNEYKFCAGHGNGISACNGDSGGGFLVFVPDNAGSTTFNASAGSWFLKGIVSLSVSRSDAPICDPNQYVIFVDVAKYEDWLDRHMN